jgi:hypothetical protein
MHPLSTREPHIAYLDHINFVDRMARTEELQQISGFSVNQIKQWYNPVDTMRRQVPVVMK